MLIEYDDYVKFIAGMFAALLLVGVGYFVKQFTEAPAPTVTAASAEKLEETADRVDLALTRVEFRLEQTRRHLWSVTSVNGRMVRICLDCGDSYIDPRPIEDVHGGGRRGEAGMNLMNLVGVWLCGIGVGISIAGMLVWWEAGRGGGDEQV